MVFKAKTGLCRNKQHKQKKRHEKEKRRPQGRTPVAGSVGAARPVAATSCARNNKWCIHEPREQGLCRGFEVCTRNDERPTLLLVHSKGVKKA